MVFFLKEPLSFIEINPPSDPVENYLQDSPLFSDLAPAFSSNRTRSPRPLVLHTDP